MDIVDVIKIKKYDKATKIIRLWAIAMLNYRQSLGDKAWALIRELTDNDTTTALSFLTGFCSGGGSLDVKKLEKLIPELKKNDKGGKMKAKALIIIDMQRDFIHPQGKLPVPNASDIVNTIDQLRQKAYEKGIKVIYAIDWHAENDPEFKVWPPHCIENTEGAEIIKELAPREDDLIIQKNRFSAFSNKDVIELLKDVDEVFLTGVATEYCVRGFALGEPENDIDGAAGLDKKVNLVVDAIRGVDEIPGVLKTKGKVVYSAVEMGKVGVVPMYFEEAMESF